MSFPGQKPQRTGGLCPREIPAAAFLQQFTEHAADSGCSGRSIPFLQQLHWTWDWTPNQLSQRRLQRWEFKSAEERCSFSPFVSALHDKVRQLFSLLQCRLQRPCTTMQDKRTKSCRFQKAPSSASWTEKPTRTTVSGRESSTASLASFPRCWWRICPGSERTETGREKAAHRCGDAL